MVIAASAVQAEDKAPSNWLLFFQQGEYTLTSEARIIVAAAAEQAKEFPNYRLEVIGHDEWVLPRDESLTLSQQRATETAKELVKFGVTASRILVGGVGSKEPLVPNERGVAEAQNRFVEIKFVLMAEKNTKAYLQQFK